LQAGARLWPLDESAPTVGGVTFPYGLSRGRLRPTVE
jgi:hypothetical protein